MRKPPSYLVIVFFGCSVGQRIVGLWNVSKLFTKTYLFIPESNICTKDVQWNMIILYIKIYLI